MPTNHAWSPMKPWNSAKHVPFKLYFPSSTKYYHSTDFRPQTTPLKERRRDVLKKEAVKKAMQKIQRPVCVTTQYEREKIPGFHDSCDEKRKQIEEKRNHWFKTEMDQEKEKFHGIQKSILSSFRAEKRKKERLKCIQDKKVVVPEIRPEIDYRVIQKKRRERHTVSFKDLPEEQSTVSYHYDDAERSMKQIYKRWKQKNISGTLAEKL